MHFGHCDQFTLIDVSPDSRAITGQATLTPPPHEPGLYPRWLHEQGATTIIAGGMGSRAVQLFDQQNIQVVTGASGGTPEEIVKAYIAGSLQTGNNTCDH
jgi:predicted Fe-Mo cluster-binding NifX family protein